MCIRDSSDIQYTSVTPDKILNSLVYRTLLYVNIYGSFKLSKQSGFLVHPVAKNDPLNKPVFASFMFKGDGMTDSLGHKFSTKDQDNDGSKGFDCARYHRGGWWYSACFRCHLNGEYFKGTPNKWWNGINWYPWKGKFYSLKFTEMKIRPW